MSFGRFIALGSFILTLGTIFLTYWVATSQGTAPLCNPFIDGCTDITHTGMKGDAGFIFRGGLIAASAFLLIWWMLNFVWLEQKMTKGGRVALYVASGFGILAAMALVVSTATLLPEKSQVPWAAHVYAANVFFQGTFLGLTILHILIFFAHKRGLAVPSMGFKNLIFIGLWSLLIFYSGVTIAVEIDHKNRLAEWSATCLISFYYLTSFWDFKSLRLVVSSDQSK